MTVGTYLFRLLWSLFGLPLLLMGQAKEITLELDVFESTRFQGATLYDLQGSQGDQLSLEEKFGERFVKNSLEDPDYYWVNYKSSSAGKGILINYNDEDDDGTLEFTAIRIPGAQTPVVLAGTTIRVGDSLTKLGLDPTASNVSEKGYWVFRTGLGDPVIYVRYDLQELKIIEIGYSGG